MIIYYEVCTLTQANTNRFSMAECRLEKMFKIYYWKIMLHNWKKIPFKSVF